MEDKRLYEQILGLEAPWHVASVTMKAKERTIEVEVCVTEGQLWACPECKVRMHVHGYEKRKWRHLDTCQFETIIVADVPRVRCETHGTEMVSVPWAERYSRFTMLFERFAVDVLLETSILGGCELLGISWSEADGIKQRAVTRGLARKVRQVPKRVCVDEKSMGSGHNYVTVVLRADAGTKTVVDYIGDGRTAESLSGYWSMYTQEELTTVEAVAMDMWEPFITATKAGVPGAVEKIVHDPFHIAQHMNNAVNDVRKAEHRALSAKGDERLKNTKFMFLRAYENIPSYQEERFSELRSAKLQTSKAWIIKELLRDFWASPSVDEATQFLASWSSWAMRCRLKPVKRVAMMIKRHLAGVLNFFRHRITNAAAEGFNNLISSLVAKSFGYRNQERFKIDILFHAGGLDLYPGVAQ